MEERSPVMVGLLSAITCGIYQIVWYVKTKAEINQRGGEVPTAWLLLVPVVNLWWIYKYCVGVEDVSNGEHSAALSLVLILLTGPIAPAVIQSFFNNLE